jgi:hypothetical protein
LAVVWFIQQPVLAENDEELRRNNFHSEKQIQATTAIEVNVRQETFFKIVESTRKQLGSIAGLLFVSSQGPIGNDNYTFEDMADVWRQFVGGEWGMLRYSLACS